MTRFASRARSPLTLVLVALAVLNVVGIGWGLPATDGWDNDGVAPRDFWVGVALTFTRGGYYTYPPVHLLLLAVATLPIGIVVAAKAASLSAADIVREALCTPYMTGFAIVARAISVLMAVGIAWAVAKMAEELRARRAAPWAAAACGVNLSLTYYAHTTNLDVPYLFWGTLALLALMRAIVRREPERLRTFAVLAVLAVGTKDQAYGLFLLSAPVVLVAWGALDPEVRAHGRLAREALRALALAVGLFAIVDAVILNPSGFRARVAFLLGGASQDFASYSKDTWGRLLVVKDCVGFFDHYYPWPFLLLIPMGLAWLVARRNEGPPGQPSSDASEVRRLRLAALVPLLAAVSFTITFNCTARRTDHRFVLPQWTLVSLYAGLALHALAHASWWVPRRPARARLLRWLGPAIAGAVVILSAWRCVEVDALLLGDPRYDAERWLAENVPKGGEAPADEASVETYGLNVYLPRFPAWAAVSRVGPEPIAGRNPLPGVREIQDAFDRAPARCPRFIVVSEGWVWRYLLDPSAFPSEGRILPRTQALTGGDSVSTAYFGSLVSGRAGYRLAHASRFQSGVFPERDIHASTARQIWIYERESRTCR